MQEDKFSLAAQTHELTNYAKSQGWKIVELFQDVDSGTKINKVGLEALLDCVEDGKVDVVLVIEQDRLSRLDTVAWEFLKTILRENNVKIAEPGVLTDLSNSNDEFFSDLKNLLAQHARRDILRKFMRGKRQFTREGNVWGKQPEEYIYDPATKSLTENKERSWIIEYIDDLYLNHNLGCTSIAKRLNKICKTAEGKEWTSQQVLAKLKRKSFHGVLEKKFSNGETITVEDVYPKIRTEETYNRIQVRLKANKIRKPAEPHFLRNVTIRCAGCGKIVSVKKSWAYGKKENQTYPVWTLQHMNERTVELCEGKPYVNIKRIEKGLVQAVKAILTDEEKANEYIESDFDENELMKIKKEITQLKKMQHTIQEKVDRLLDLYLDGKWNKDKLDSEREKLDAQLDDTNNSLEELIRKQELIQASQLNYDTIVEFMAAADRFDSELDVEDQQELIGSLFPSGVLDLENDVLIFKALLPQQVTVDIKIPIESTEEVKKREMYEFAKSRYFEAQAYLNKHPNTPLQTVAHAIGSQPPTLNKYQEWFGPLKHVAINRQSPELRKQHVEEIKKALAKNPKAPGRKLEEMTGINRKRIYRLIKEENLRP